MGAHRGDEATQEQTILRGYRDDFPATAPVGCFLANAFGIFDLGRIAWEWCESTYENGNSERVLRGGFLG